MLLPDTPALILAPMEGLNDAPMRAVQGELGAFTFTVSEFMRISGSVPTRRAWFRHVPELHPAPARPFRLPVQVQLLGGDPDRLAQAALVAVRAGAWGIDLNFGCPAPTVNKHDGGATLLQYPRRIREIVAAVRGAVPAELPVSAKLRLGWDSPDAIHENAAMAAEGGASWLTIHGRTRAQGYRPPALWEPMRTVRERLGIPVVANGDLWTVDDLRRCRDVTGCIHFMLGRGALANPRLSHEAARELGLPFCPETIEKPFAWPESLERLIDWTTHLHGEASARHMVGRLKQWLKIAAHFGDYPDFDALKPAASVDEILATVRSSTSAVHDSYTIAV